MDGISLVQTRNVDALSEPTGPYSHLARSGDFVFLAGMVGVDPAVEATGLYRQSMVAFENVLHCLREEGGGYADVVKFTINIVVGQPLEEFHRARQMSFNAVGLDEQFPPSSLYLVSGLADPRAMIEIDTVAYIPRTTM